MKFVCDVNLQCNMKCIHWNGISFIPCGFQLFRIKYRCCQLITALNHFNVCHSCTFYCTNRGDHKCAATWLWNNCVRMSNILLVHSSQNVKIVHLFTVRQRNVHRIWTKVKHKIQGLYTKKKRMSEIARLKSRQMHPKILLYFSPKELYFQMSSNTYKLIKDV